jgi:hypothetical protein
MAAWGQFLVDVAEIKGLMKTFSIYGIHHDMGDIYNMTPCNVDDE